MINWENITPEEFEELCYLLLEENEFYNLEWYGKSGGDKGRDILAEKNFIPFKNKNINQKWLCQCKRYTKKKITKTMIQEILNSAKEHNIDYLLLAITDILTSDIKDWINNIKKEYKFELIIWEDLDLKREINRNLVKITSRFPKLIKKIDSISFYEMGHAGTTYMCDEFDEVGFYLSNKYNKEDDIKMINEFIQFIKSNDIIFNEDD